MSFSALPLLGRKGSSSSSSGKWEEKLCFLWAEKRKYTRNVILRKWIPVKNIPNLGVIYTINMIWDEVVLSKCARSEPSECKSLFSSGPSNTPLCCKRLLERNLCIKMNWRKDANERWPHALGIFLWISQEYYYYYY